MILEIELDNGIKDLDDVFVRYLDDIFSLGDDSQISSKALQSLWHCGSTAVKARLNVLIESGYIYRNIYRNCLGAYDQTRYELTDKSLSLKIARSQYE